MSQHTERLQRLLGARYKVKRALGRGGMGEVVAAWDRKLDQAVAIKVLEQVPDLERYQREAKTLAKLRHPRIVRVLDAGSLDDGRQYYVMDLLQGQTLDQRIRALAAQGKVIDPRVAAYHGTHLLDALAAAHAAGIVHRDVKLENAIVDREGDLTLFDFGLALTPEVTGPVAAPATRGRGRANEMRTNETAKSLLVGTPRYLAPELIRGAKADARSDLYAAGVVLGWLLTGEYVLPLRDRSDQAILEAHLHTPPAPRWEKTPDCPPEIKAIVLMLLAKDPEDRIQTAEAAGDALGAALRGSIQPDHALARRLAKDDRERRAREIYEVHAAREARDEATEARSSDATKPLGSREAQDEAPEEPPEVHPADVTKVLGSRLVASALAAPPAPLRTPMLPPPPSDPRPEPWTPGDPTDVTKELDPRARAAATATPSPPSKPSAPSKPSPWGTTPSATVDAHAPPPPRPPRRRRLDGVLLAIAAGAVGYLLAKCPPETRSATAPAGSTSVAASAASATAPATSTTAASTARAAASATAATSTTGAAASATATSASAPASTRTTGAGRAGPRVTKAAPPPLPFPSPFPR